MTAFTFKYNGNGFLSTATDTDLYNIEDKLKVGESYSFKLNEEDRSDVHHRWFFAVIGKAHANLPERFESRFPTSETLRKWLLIKVGHCETADCVADNPKEVSSVFRWQDPYAVIVVKDNVISVSRAKSQRYKKQDQKEFQEVTSACVHLLAQILGCDPAALLEGSEAPAWMHERASAA